MNRLNVVIPAAGRGERFSSSGYDLPKPLIPIKNKTMIEWAIETLGFDPSSTSYTVITRQYQDADLNNRLTSTISNISADITEMTIDHLTEGPASTALLAMNRINNDTPLIICNCDQIMRWNGEFFLSSVINSGYDGVVVTYEESNPRNSYAQIDNKGNVLRIVEKQVISNISLNGIHFWNKGRYFVDSALRMISNNERYNNEFYVGPSYNELIKAGLKVGIYHIPRECHIPVGVPTDLESFVENLAK